MALRFRDALMARVERRCGSPVCRRTSADDHRGAAAVRSSTSIAIAAGESEFTRFDFRDLIEIDAVDVLQPDLAICGGPTEAY